MPILNTPSQKETARHTAVIDQAQHHPTPRQGGGALFAQRGRVGRGTSTISSETVRAAPLRVVVVIFDLTFRFGALVLTCTTVAREPTVVCVGGESRRAALGPRL